MDSSFWFDTITWHGPLYIWRDHRSNCIFISEDQFCHKNSVDPDKMSGYVAFHLGIHCLPSTHSGGHQ